jgi:hypothetical protein
MNAILIVLMMSCFYLILFSSGTLAFAESDDSPPQSMPPHNKAKTNDDNDHNDDGQPQSSNGKIPTYVCNGKRIPITADCAHEAKIDNDNDKKFFRSGNNEIKEIPVIPRINFATTANETTANVTIPVCNGVVGGPCLDPNTHTIIP